MAGDVQGERLTLVGALVRDHGCGRAAVADAKLEALADGLAVAVGRRHRDGIVAEVAVGWSSRDDAGERVDMEARRQGGAKRQRIAGRRSREVAGDIEGERLTFVGALVRDHGCGWAAVADGKLEALADGFAVGI